MEDVEAPKTEADNKVDKVTIAVEANTNTMAMVDPNPHLGVVIPTLGSKINLSNKVGVVIWEAITKWVVKMHGGKDPNKTPHGIAAINR